jgi:hypothetical protein
MLISTMQANPSHPQTPPETESSWPCILIASIRARALSKWRAISSFGSCVVPSKVLPTRQGTRCRSDRCIPGHRHGNPGTEDKREKSNRNKDLLLTATPTRMADLWGTRMSAIDVHGRLLGLLCLLRIKCPCATGRANYRGCSGRIKISQKTSAAP